MDNQNTVPVRGRGRPSKFSDMEIMKAMDMLRAGATLAEAGRAVGMSVTNVAYYRDKHNVAGASVPGVMPTVAVDPLASVENKLLSQYDSEISRLETTISKASERLKLTVQRRKKVAKALGLVEAAEPESTVSTDVLPRLEDLNVIG